MLNRFFSKRGATTLTSNYYLLSGAKPLNANYILGQLTIPSKGYLIKTRYMIACNWAQTTAHNCTSKGSYRSRKKILKVSFPGVAVCGSCDVWQSRCGGVAMHGSRGVGELRCGGVAVWGNKLQCGGVAGAIIIFFHGTSIREADTLC